MCFVTLINYFYLRDIHFTLCSIKVGTLKYFEIEAIENICISALLV